MFPFDVNFLSVTLLLSVLIYLIYIYLTINFDYWKKRGVPFPKPSPLFGNYKDIMLFRLSSASVYKKLYEEFPNEKLVGVFKIRRPDLMVKDFELIKHVLVKDFQYFQDRFADITTDVEPLNYNLFNTDKTKWKSLRQKSTPIFTSGKLKNMFHLIIEKANEFEEYISTTVVKTGEEEMREVMAKFTTEVIGSCAFGVKMNSMADENAPFRKMGRKVFTSSIRKSLKIVLRIMSPELFAFLRLRIQDYDIEEFFVTTVMEIVKEREKTNVCRHDFIDLLLELRKSLGSRKTNGVVDQSELTEEDFTDVFMTAQVFIFFLAGFETSSTLMAFALNELAFHPEIQDKVVSEIKSVLSKYDNKLTYDGILEMKYLEMVICETQRKYPALGVLTRVCNAKYTFPGTDITIDKGISVAIPLLAIHYDPDIYPEPKKFIPERFSAENRENRHPMAFMPFGEGPRNCIGLRFGKIQSMVGLITFLRKFKVEPTKRSEKQVKIDPRSFVTAGKNGIWLKISLRNP